MQPMTTGLLDQLVLSKPYFEREGLIVAEDQGQPVGFAHAGFAPNDDGSDLDREIGILCLIMVAPHAEQQEIASQLLAHSERYLTERGARAIYGGSYDDRGPFYLGLYGGTGAPGVLASDQMQLDTYRAAGYETLQRTRILQRELAGFRPLIDRRIIQLKRELQLEASADLLPATWWDACTLGQIDRTQFMLTPRNGGRPIGIAHFWDVEPMASSWGVHAMGLLEINIDDVGREEHEAAQLTTFLFGESIRQLQSCGVTLVEVLVHDTDDLLGETCQRLGFQEVNQGIRFCKPVQ
jgi:GNAT superfamily N-acetyltransferase